MNEANVSTTRSLSPSSIRRQWLYYWPFLKFLGSKNHSALFEEESEIAGEIKASGEPRALRNIKLGPTLCGKTSEMLYGAAESLCIRRLAVSDSAEFGYRHDDSFRGRVVEEELGAGNRVL